MSSRRAAAGALAAILWASPAFAQPPSLLPEATVGALARELSGETAKRNLEYLTRLHRMAGSPAFRDAIEFVAARAREAGLVEIRLDSFPADGQRFYGTQRSRPAWWVTAGELWELADNGEGRVPTTRLASWTAMPLTIANMSEGGTAEAELVDVGDGTRPEDYAGKNVRGRFVLAAAQPGPVAPLAIGQHGAAGIVSYAQNQRNAWWGQDDRLIRWGHYDAFAPHNRLGFMVSLGTARRLRERLAAGETIRLRGRIDGGRAPGHYQVLSAAIPGADPERRGEEIVFSCHLDHPRPGANDNASGCATILEVGRALARLVADGRIPRPARTLRFVWPPEIEGTLALLVSRPDFTRRIQAVVHMDMVGGGPVTKAIFRVGRTPSSLPSVVSDIGHAWTDLVNRESATFASTGRARWPLVAAEGGREPFAALLDDFGLGSDHEIYTEASFGIPAIYLSQWPDRYIHTNYDLPANIDPTVLLRAGFVGAASALTLADMGAAHAGAVTELLASQALRRTAAMVERQAGLAPADAAALARYHWDAERRTLASVERFTPLPDAARARVARLLDALEAGAGKPAPAPAPSGAGAVVYRRNPDVAGPMSAFAYDYFVDHYGADEASRVRLRSYVGAWGDGSDYVYEALNLVDGRRSVQAIRDHLTAVYGPVPLEIVAEYLAALERIEVIRR